MPTPQLSSLNPNATLDELKDYLIGLNRYLNYLLSSLDTLNISRLDAKVIIAQTITAVQIAAGAITADKIDVAQLSAISANLGKVVAGILVGAYISTADGTYPRVELSSSGNLLGAFLDATHSVSIEPNIGGGPGIGFKDPSGLTGRIYGNSGLGMIALIDNIELTSLSGNVDINAPNGVSINGVSGLLGTKVYYVANSSGGAVTRKLTFTNGLLTSET